MGDNNVDVVGSVDTTVDTSEDTIDIEWNGDQMTVTADEYEDLLSTVTGFGINTAATKSTKYMFNQITKSVAGIFGMPYQFSTNVDPAIEINSTQTKYAIYNTSGKIGRKFTEKIFSIAPVLFLTPGEPKFMAGYDNKAKRRMAETLVSLGDDDNTDEFDEGRYYSFISNFPEYKKYANVALRALAMFMGIGDVKVVPPGTVGNGTKLSNIDVEKYMNNDFTKLFGTQCVVPFYLDAESAINETFTNNTTESMIAQTVNGFSQTAKEIQFIMGSKDSGGVMQSIGAAVTDVASNITSALGDVAEVLAGKNLITRVSNELTTIVSGGKIIFPEIWSDSEYDRSFDITIKLRSPDPDPVSIFLNIYMPIILLVSMAAPHQIGNSSNSYESPFLVRATYKSIFNCDLGMITSLSISKGGQGNWNVLGQPISADVTLSIRDLYGSMFISKRMGLICNTAQMDYLATMAGVDLNEFEPTRMIKLYAQILGDTPRDWANDMWGGVKRSLNIAAAKVLSNFSDTRYLGY